MGKTYLAYDFAKAFFARILYFNLERDPNLAALFAQFDQKELREELINYYQNQGEPIPADDTILIIDEFSPNPEVLQKLIRLQQSNLFPNIIAITSNGKIADINMDDVYPICVYPLDFDEFLRATANEWYIDAIEMHYQFNTKIPEIVHKELMEFFQLYLRIGGMPGAINEYLNLAVEINVGEQHNILLGSYIDYIVKNNTESDALKMKQVLDSIPLQLRKQNKKFQYKLIRKGTTHNMYKDAISYLVSQNYVIPCNKIESKLLRQGSTASLEVINKELSNHFKLYTSDVGILHTKFSEQKEPRTKLLGQEIIKSLIENYVAQALVTKEYDFGFWESESMAKIDFIMKKENEIYPIEIFPYENTRSKSISIFKQVCEFPYAIKISSRNFEYSNGVRYIPLYAIFCL